MTHKYFKHRVETVCNTCGKIIESQRAECIDRNRRWSADANQYIDSDDHVDICEVCSQ